MRTFDERFEGVYPRIQALANRFARSTPIPAAEYESYLCEEYIKVDAAFDPKVNNSYNAFVGAMLEMKAKTLASNRGNSKMRRFYDSIQYIDITEEDEESGKYPSELVDDVDIEQSTFDVMFIEEQLAKADEVTRKILELFFADPYASFREIARELGLHDKLVKRRLEAVALAVRDA